MVYALTGSSFRPGPRVVGDFNLRLSARENQFTNLPPEKSKSYEIGAKTSFLDGRGRFNVAGYHQTFKNYPFRGPGINYLNYATANGLDASGNPLPAAAQFNFVSPVPVTVNGVEGEASFQILDRWSLGVNAAYSDGKIKNGTIACNDLNRDGIPDANVVFPSTAVLQASLPAGENVAVCSGINRRSLSAPKFGANATSEFNFDVGASADGFVRGLYTLFGKTANDPDNGFDDVGSYGLLNLYAGIRADDGSWEVTLFGKNVTKEREILDVGSGALATTYRRLTPPTFRVPVTETFTSQYRSIRVTAPREFGITAKIALGGR
jgi:iron complex outermembrane recepter protein